MSYYESSWAKTERNWAIWRERVTTGARFKDIAQRHGITTERARQITKKHGRRVQRALCSTRGTHDFPEGLRDAILGVEFVFTHEGVIDTIGAYEDWRGFEPLSIAVYDYIGRQLPNHAFDEGIYYRIEKEDLCPASTCRRSSSSTEPEPCSTTSTPT